MSFPFSFLAPGVQLTNTPYPPKLASILIVYPVEIVFPLLHGHTTPRRCLEQQLLQFVQLVVEHHLVLQLLSGEPVPAARQLKVSSGCEPKEFYVAE